MRIIFLTQTLKKFRSKKKIITFNLQRNEIEKKNTFTTLDYAGRYMTSNKIL